MVAWASEKSPDGRLALQRGQGLMQSCTFRAVLWFNRWVGTAPMHMLATIRPAAQPVVEPCKTLTWSCSHLMESPGTTLAGFRF